MSNDQQDERWHVQLDSKEVRLMTLEQLDEAFQHGLVHEHTYVIQVGSSSWQTLGEVAGLGEEPQLAPSNGAPSVNAGAPIARAPGAGYQVPEQSQSVRPVARAAVGGWPPVTIAPGQPAAMAVAASSMPPGYLHASHSVIPVVQSVGPSYDFGPADFKPRKSKLFVALGVGASALAAAVFALTRLDAPPTQAEAPAAAPAVAAAAYIPTQPSNYSAPSTPTPSPLESENKGTNSTGSLSDETKKALLAKDNERSTSRKSRVRATASHSTSSTPSSNSKKSAGPIRGGGNTYDPLNGKL